MLCAVFKILEINKSHTEPTLKIPNRPIFRTKKKRKTSTTNHNQIKFRLDWGFYIFCVCLKFIHTVVYYLIYFRIIIRNCGLAWSSEIAYKRKARITIDSIGNMRSKYRKKYSSSFRLVGKKFHFSFFKFVVTFGSWRIFFFSFSIVWLVLSVFRSVCVRMCVHVWWSLSLTIYIYIQVYMHNSDLNSVIFASFQTDAKAIAIATAVQPKLAPTFKMYKINNHNHK